MYWLADTLLVILLILLAVSGAVLFFIWRKRRRTGSDSAYFDFKDHSFPGFFKRHAEPLPDVAVDNDPWVDGVIEDEFWVPEELDVLNKQGTTARNAPPPVDESGHLVDTASPARELIVALYVCALRGQHFNGVDMFAALEQLGLRHGEMRIYHHDGLPGQISGQARGKPVFSVVNMTEPGTFDPTQAETFKSPGLIFFMRLPGPLDGRVAFEFMLNHAYRLADLLKGNLEDEHRQTLNAETIAYLRQGIEEFEDARG